MCCTGAAPSASLSSPSSASRAARSSEKTRTLTSPCASSAAVDLAPHRRGRAVVADRDDRVQVMRLGALLLALGGAEDKGGHAPIIGAR